jgi:hypothetical protein
MGVEVLWDASFSHAALLLDFRDMTLVIACRMVTPAFSISFFDKPEVMHTFSAGCTRQLLSFGLIL